MRVPAPRVAIRKTIAVVIFVPLAACFVAAGGSEADRLELAASYHLQQGSLDSALSGFRRALELRRSLPDRVAEAATANNLATAFNRRGQPDSALSLLRPLLQRRGSIASARVLAVTLNNAGEALNNLGHSDSAMTYYAAALRAGDDSMRATALANIGIIYKETGRTDSAFAVLGSAIEVARSDGDAGTEAEILAQIGQLHRLQGRPDTAAVFFRQSLQIAQRLGRHTEVGSSLNELGGVFSDLGQRDSALTYFRAALAIAEAASDLESGATALQNMGVEHAQLGQLDSAVHFFRGAQGMLRDLGSRRLESVVVANIAYVQGMLGQLDSALFNYQVSLRISREIGDRGGEASTLGNIGSAYTQLGRSDSAIAYYQLALPIIRATGERVSEAVTLYNVGLEHRSLRPDSALAYYRASLAILREIGDRTKEATALQAIGGVFRERRQHDSALVYLRLALGAQRATGDRTGEGLTLNHIGRLYRDTANPDSALAAFTRALTLMREARYASGEAISLDNIAVLYYRAARGPKDFQNAIAYYDSAASAFERLRAAAGSDENAVSYAEQQAGVHEGWTSAWLALARSGTVEPSVGARAALAASDRGRALATLDLMRGVDSTVIAALAPTQGARSMAAEGDSILAPLAARGTAVLYYTHTGDTLVTWFLSPRGNLAAWQTPLRQDTLVATITALRAALGADDSWNRMAPRERASGADTARAANDVEAIAAPLDQLSAWLLPARVRGALGGRAEILVVPHGVLGLVPFGALRASTNDQPIGTRHALRYAPSLRALMTVESRARPDSLSGSLVVGNPVMPTVTEADGTRGPLADLPGAFEEGSWVAARLGVPLLSGARASETAFLVAVRKAPIVHLATHGLAYGGAEEVRSSYVALAPDSLNDGLLTLGELMDNRKLTFAADLMVLSACETGLGNPRRAEGTIGMQRALLAKGARTVLVSLWNVDDEATAFLMRRFYDHWLAPGGVSKAEALRLAQEEVRTNTANPHWRRPQYWAAFQLVGAR